MKKLTVIILLIVPCFAFIKTQNRQDSSSVISYPEGYRQWSHVKSGIVGPKSPAAPKYEGITHIYANDKAMEGYKSGKFPDGSVFVFDVFESVVFEGGVKEGKRKFIDVTVKDRKAFADTDGWGYEEFESSDKSKPVLTIEMKKQCFNCHQTRKDFDYIFSSYRE